MRSTTPCENGVWGHGAGIKPALQPAMSAYQTPSINGMLYEIQPQYSNAVHAPA